MVRVGRARCRLFQRSDALAEIRHQKLKRLLRIRCRECGDKRDTHRLSQSIRAIGAAGRFPQAAKLLIIQLAELVVALRDAELYAGFDLRELRP